jgi:hypothetical protein
MAYAEKQARISLDADASIGVYTAPPGSRGTSAPYWGKQYRFVKVTGAHIAGLSTNAANEQTIGVLQNKPQQVGDAASVAISGVTYMQSGAAIAAGASLKSDANGRAVTATVGTDKVLAIALDACAAADQLIPALLRVAN